MLSPARSSGERTFTATCRPSRVSSATNTRLMPPRASSRSTRNALPNAVCNSTPRSGASAGLASGDSRNCLSPSCAASSDSTSARSSTSPLHACAMNAGRSACGSSAASTKTAIIAFHRSALSTAPTRRVPDPRGVSNGTVGSTSQVRRPHCRGSLRQRKRGEARLAHTAVSRPPAGCRFQDRTVPTGHNPEIARYVGEGSGAADRALRVHEVTRGRCEPITL